MTAPAPAPAAPAAAGAELAEELWAAVVRGSEAAAAAAVFGALAAGAGPESVLLDVIGPVQARVGLEWAADRLTVAQEHAATAINERVVAALAHHPAVLAAGPGTTLGRVTVACVDGEWHAFPARLLAQVLTLRGWTVDYLGAQVPTPHLIEHLHRTGPAALALSASLAPRLPTAHTAITAAQAVGVPVLAGGAAFGPGGRYARLLGADAWAADARGAADRLAAGLAAPVPGHQPIDDLPHLADQEYTLVGRSAPHLVRAVMAGLAERIPAVRDYTEEQLQHTAEDVAHLVDFLAAALYTDDPELFGTFLSWTAGVLTARAVPAASLLPAVALLRHELRDLPRAVAVLDHGRCAVAAAAGAPATAPTPEHGIPA
ncbi:B12-binding domain-containing protein [Kitasatospora sp. NPDC006697]|uniref:cobalamin B12-binding domain-containing protein n=1 Tax=Kitasatospora sp. NPDC006697 TaxID=3364020 RepID=UPI0036891268